MHTVIDRLVSYSHHHPHPPLGTHCAPLHNKCTVQSSHSKPPATGFQKTAVTSYSQQSSRSPNGTTTTTSTIKSTFQQVGGKNGFTQSFSSTQIQQTTNARAQHNAKCGQFGSHTASSSHIQIKHDKHPPCSQKFHCSSNVQIKQCKGGGAHQSNWSNTTVENNKASIDLGRYSLDLNKSNSSILLTNKQTGDTTKIWGDPHITTNGTSGTFNGSLTFALPDHTKVTVGTQAKGSVSYADQLTITQGNKAYVVNGLSQANSNPLTVERTGNGRLLDRMTPDGYTLVANRSGTGWIDPQTGRAPTAADFKNA